MGNISKYFSMVKFSHTVFAMPFGLIGYVYALESTGRYFEWALLVKIILCMVFARNTAMGFNRWADRKIDATNPRTANREIPSGKITPWAAMIFIIVNAMLFMCTTAFINITAFALSPLALVIVMGYSLTKRFTAWSHIVLGLSLAIAPIGAYIAVTGHIDLLPLILGVVVITWVGGFDILYSLQDAEYDRAHKLHSIPARFSARTSVWISILLHLITALAVVATGYYYAADFIYWTGAGLFIVLLIFQHIMFTPSHTGRIAAAFGLINGLSSLTYAAFTIADMVIK